MDDANEAPRRSDRGSAMIAAALVLSALILNFGLSSATPRYQLVASGGAVVQMDNDSGAMIACDLRQCRQVRQPDRARTLRPLRDLIGGSGGETGQKQIAPPPSR